MPSGREDGLGMELDAVGGQLAVLHAHDHAAAGGGDAQALGDDGVDDERVVAADHERRGQPGEQPVAVVRDLRRLAVHRHVADRRCRRRPGRATGGRGRRRASAPRPRGSGA